MTRIAIDISQIVYSGSGVSRYIESLVTEIVRLDQHNEYILFGNSLRKKDLLDNYFQSLIKINERVKKKFLSIPQTLMEILWNRLHILPIEKFTGKVNMVHTSDWVEPPSSIPKVTTIHDFLVFKFPYLFPDEIVDTQKRRVSWVISESKKIIVDSEATKRDGIDLLSIPENKIEVVYPGVSDKFFPRSDANINEIKKKYKIKKPYLLSVGTREPRKNIANTIEAFLKLNKSYDIELIIAGKLGWGVEKKYNNEQIKFLGFIPDTDLPSLYSGASCFVYPSISEGFGFPILEAMASGTSVVTSKGGSLQEVGGKYAEYINPESSDSIAEGISKVLNNQDYQKRESIKWAKSFTWTNSAKKVLKIYEQIAL